MRTLKFILLLLPLMVYLSAVGQDASFRASVTKNTVGLNENFQLTFQLDNADGRNFKPPVFNDFNVLSGPNQSTQMSITNGAMTRSMALTYYLQARSVGKFTLGSASIEVGGKTYVSNKIPIEVVKGNAPQAGTGGNGSNGAKGGKGGGGNVQEQLKENLFARVSVDRSEVYQGEQVTATYKLYSRTQIGNTSLTKEPSFTGFWKQELDVPQQLSFQNETYNGGRYNAALIKKVALFPEQTGDLEIEPMGLNSVVRVQVQRQSHGFFDDFFGNYEDIKYDYESNKAKIKVKPLPSAGKPADFSGFVGSLGMEVVMDKHETKTDDPITISVRFNGKGNLKVISTPKVDLPSDFDIFDPKLTEKMNKSDVISGGRNYDFLIIPRRPGTFKLPPISVSYFDPVSEKYKTLTSGELSITVTGQPSKSSGTGNISGVSKEEVQLLGQDIRYIHGASGGLKKPEGYFFGSKAFAGLYGAPVVMFLFLLAYRRRKEQMDSDTVLVRKRGASKEANKHLKTAKALLDKNDEKGFYNELSRALWGYIGDKLNIDPSALNHETAMTALLARNVPEETIATTFRIIGDCEIALYAPSALVGTMSSLFEEARQTIDKLETTLDK